MSKSLLKTYVFVPGTAGNAKLIVPGKIDLQQLLVITDTTKNTILYNFSDSNFSGTTVTFTRGDVSAYATDFQNILSTADGYTTVNLVYVNASVAAGFAATDAVQIFYDTPTQFVRMYGAGTDAFERTRVSPPQSMLDADFEYGLQPTKWQTIDVLRGYPSIYEFPGTDITVTAVVTDASSGTSNVGASLITVTCSQAHNYISGQPITIKGLSNTTLGFARAEGTFIINQITSATTFNYYAKAKVGSSVVTATSSTYTASAGASTGTFTTLAGTITVGMVLTGTGVETGTTVTSVSGTTLTFSQALGTLSGTITFTGEIVSSTYTQLRRGGFFTGASVGAPQYSVTTDGSGSAYATITIGFASPHGFVPGNSIMSVVSSAGSNHPYAAGPFYAESVPSPTELRYTARAYGAVAQGTALASVVIAGTAGQITCTSTTLTTGQPIAIIGTFAGTGTIVGPDGRTYGAAGGSNVSDLTNNPLVLYVQTGGTGTSFTLTTTPGGTAAVTTTGTPTGLTYTPQTLTGTIYARPDCFYSHRPFDGGVILGTGGPAHGAHAIRMSKKYIRYQSGKSINYNTGLLLAPNYDIRSLVATGTATTTTPLTSVATTANSTTVSCASATVANGQLISGANIPAGSYIVSGGGAGVTSFVINIPVPSQTAGSGGTATVTPGIQVTTDDIDHALQASATILITGVTSSGFNGQYTVGAIIDERNFIIPVNTTLGVTTAVIGSPCLVSTLGWVGSTVRAGTFDDQNGQFWQYDGQTVAVGYRTSTLQTAGVISVTPDNNTITQSSATVPTRFQEQFAEGDRVVIRGMSHTVTSIKDNTTMYVTPDYRGSAAQNGIKMVKTKDYLYKQSEWNIDRCDGSNGPFNPSGFKLNVNKMQMVGIAWTWYGAGFIEWQLRGPDGNYIPVHRVKHSNVNTEAYMRSGNQPVRYEVINEGPRTQLYATAASSDTTLTVKDTSWFPTSGFLWMEGEIIKYTGKTQATKYDPATDVGSGTFTGCTRQDKTFTQFIAGQQRNFLGGVPQSTTSLNTGVILLNQLATPVISHWGSAFLQDGGFDADRGYIFNYSATNINVSTKKTTAFAIRLAPSVSNAIVGDLGVRDLLNRAQLLLQGIEITAGAATGSNSAIVIEGVLNPINYPSNINNITWGGLQSSSAGGLPSFCQIAPNTVATPITFDGQATVSTTTAATTPAIGATSLQVNGVTSISITAIGAGGSVTVASTAFTKDQPVAISGTQSGTGSIAGYIPGTVYYIQTAGTTTTPILLTSPGGVPVVTGAGTSSGLTLVSNPILIGDEVWSSAASATFAGNTKVSALTTYPTTTTAQLTIDKATVGIITLTTTSVTITRGTSASPGETIFSFISSPANKDSLDLTPLKELVNTPVGGRGTFPNGPDVLMINVYLTQGAPVTGNLVLRWGEAQA
jgi:hypothetical protein